MGSSQQFSLRWNNYLKHITCAFDTLRTDEDLVDVTLSCEGKRIRAHKMLLSACSTYFRDLFKENPCQHPVIIFRNVKFDDLAALVDFMYQGEVNVVQEQLASFLTTAELLAVQGLTDGTGKDNDSLEEDIEIPNEPEVQLQNTSGKSSGENKRNKSPSSPIPFHSVELQPEIHPNKRRKTRDTNAEKNSAGSNASGKDTDSKTSDSQSRPGSDPVEIIPLMPNLKVEMPEYLEQDGSSCSYEDQSLGDNPLNKNTIDDTSSTPDHEQKVDISQTFYSSQSTSDGLDSKHQSSDVGHLLSKPSTSGERLAPEIVQGFLKEYMDEKCDGILADLESVKKSILYDVDQKINDLKNTAISNPITKIPEEKITDCMKLQENLGVALPLQTMEDFISFEETVATCQQKKRALKEFYRVLVYAETSLKACVKKIMTITMSKAVEIKYSAFGRQKNGCGKLDFSKTQTYACLNDTLTEKFGHAGEYKQFSTILSRWMIGAADREGGRKLRERP